MDVYRRMLLIWWSVHRANKSVITDELKIYTTAVVKKKITIFWSHNGKCKVKNHYSWQGTWKVS